MGTLNESVTTLGFTVTSLILINCKKDVPMFVKLSLYSLLLSWLWEFLLGSLIPPRLCCVPAPPSPHCLINFCRWQKLTQICVYQEIINISSQVFLSAVFCLLFLWIWPPVLTRASVNERIFCQTAASSWSAQSGVTSVSQESGYIQHQGQGWSGDNLKSTSFALASGECCSAVTKMLAKILEFALLCVVMSEAFYSHFMKAIWVPFILHFTALVELLGLLKLFTARVSSIQGKRNNFKTYYPSKQNDRSIISH